MPPCKVQALTALRSVGPFSARCAPSGSLAHRRAPGDPPDELDDEDKGRVLAGGERGRLIWSMRALQSSSCATSSTNGAAATTSDRRHSGGRLPARQSPGPRRRTSRVRAGGSRDPLGRGTTLRDHQNGVPVVQELVRVCAGHRRRLLSRLRPGGRRAGTLRAPSRRRAPRRPGTAPACSGRAGRGRAARCRPSRAITFVEVPRNRRPRSARSRSRGSAGGARRPTCERSGRSRPLRWSRSSSRSCGSCDHRS
jgi:hypothetical protein